MKAALLELEVGQVLHSVNELDGQRAAGPNPTLICLPDIRISVAGGVVAQTAVARGNRLFNCIEGGCG